MSKKNVGSVTFRSSIEPFVSINSNFPALHCFKAFSKGVVFGKRELAEGPSTL